MDPRRLAYRRRGEYGEDTRFVLLSETLPVIFFALLHIFLKELLNIMGSSDHT